MKPGSQTLLSVLAGLGISGLFSFLVGTYVVGNKIGDPARYYGNMMLGSIPVALTVDQLNRRSLKRQQKELFKDPVIALANTLGREDLSAKDAANISRQLIGAMKAQALAPTEAQKQAINEALTAKLAQSNPDTTVEIGGIMGDL